MAITLNPPTQRATSFLLHAEQCDYKLHTNNSSDTLYHSQCGALMVQLMPVYNCTDDLNVEVTVDSTIGVSDPKLIDNAMRACDGLINLTRNTLLDIAMVSDNVYVNNSDTMQLFIAEPTLIPLDEDGGYDEAISDIMNVGIDPKLNPAFWDLHSGMIEIAALDPKHGLKVAYGYRISVFYRLSSTSCAEHRFYVEREDVIEFARFCAGIYDLL